MEITHEVLSRLSTEIVQKFKNDFTDRRGLRQEWEQIDEEIQNEIIAKWENDTYRILRNKFKDELTIDLKPSKEDATLPTYLQILRNPKLIEKNKISEATLENMRNEWLNNGGKL